VLRFLVQEDAVQHKYGHFTSLFVVLHHVVLHTSLCNRLGEACKACFLPH
jgi:hypothetical protein